MFELAGYLKRIGLEPGFGHGLDPDGSGAGALSVSELAAIHRAHVTAIPFENLDPRRGRRVLLDRASLFGKLVTDRRGGYCYEQNLLLGAALEELGLRVEPMLARVRFGRPAGAQLPLTHLLLRVTDGSGEAWHCDVGFGNGTLLEPIPFGPGEPHEQSGWSYRVVPDADELVLQTLVDGAWRDVYSFLPRPVQPIDIELSNWYTATHPDSAFVRGLLVAVVQENGARTVMSDFRGQMTLIEARPGETISRAVGDSEVPQLLRERFGLEVDLDPEPVHSSVSVG